MTTAEKRAEARRLRDEGLTLDQIATRMGYAHASGATRLLMHPETLRARNRRSNATRAAAKRAWENEHDRGKCACGAALTIGARRRGTATCRSCYVEIQTVGRAMRQERIAEMWAAGETLRSIADALGATAKSIGSEMARMRAAGWDLPRRHNWTPEGLERAQSASRAA